MTPPQRIIAADLAADLGNRLVSLALLDLLVFKGADPFWHLVGLTLAQQVPSIVLSPSAGAVVDRIGASRWLVATLLCKSLVTAALVFSLQSWAVLLLYFCFISGSLFFNLGRVAILPSLVPPHQLMAFNALNESIAATGEIAGYALMGVVIAYTGQRGALQIAALLFLAAFGMALKLKPLRTGENASRRAHKQYRKAPARVCQGENVLPETSVQAPIFFSWELWLWPEAFSISLCQWY